MQLFPATTSTPAAQSGNQNATPPDLTTGMPPHRAHDDYLPIRATGRRTHGRTKQRPACHPPHTRCQVKGQRPKAAPIGLGDKCAHPTPAPHCGAARNLSSNPALTEPGRQAPPGRRTPRTPPHHPAAATRRAKRAQARAGQRPTAGQPTAPATAPQGRQPAAGPHPARPPHGHAGPIAWQARTLATTPATMGRKAQLPESQARPGKTPGQAAKQQSAESGHSQETPPSKPDTNTQTGAERTPNSKHAIFE